jgi:hypothetical protein
MVKRGETEGNWCFEQTQKCIEGYRDICFEQFIKTNSVNLNDIANLINENVSSFN